MRVDQEFGLGQMYLTANNYGAPDRRAALSKKISRERSNELDTHFEQI